MFTLKAILGAGRHASGATVSPGARVSPAPRGPSIPDAADTAAAASATPGDVMANDQAESKAAEWTPWYENICPPRQR